MLLYKQNSTRYPTTQTVTNHQTQIELSTTTITVNSDLVSSDFYSQLVSNSFASHLRELKSLDVALLLNDYEENSTVNWIGNTEGRFGTTYKNIANISILWSGFLDDAISLSLANSTYSENQNRENTKACVNATLYLVEDNKNVFSINATVHAQIVYSFTGTEWLISSEMWDFISSTFFE